jgi:hypothetical protein
MVYRHKVRVRGESMPCRPPWPHITSPPLARHSAVVYRWSIRGPSAVVGGLSVVCLVCTPFPTILPTLTTPWEIEGQPRANRVRVPAEAPIWKKSCP